MSVSSNVGIKQAGTLSDASKEIGIEVNAEVSKYIFMSCNIKILTDPLIMWQVQIFGNDSSK
jgi:hypothetical protein